VLLVLALAALAGVALALRRWIRSRAPLRLVRRLRRSAPRYPVVLAHGLFGFDELRLGAARHEYFRGVAARLEADGWEVHRPRVAKAGSIEARAAELAAYVRALPDARVNVLAHSMGGLDARWAITRLGLADRVASLVTLGTPHLGTPVADLGHGLGERSGLAAALQRAGLGLDALADLTTARMARFNAEVADAPGVTYGSVVAVARRKRDVSPLLLPTYVWLASAAGGSDGVVPAASQRWGELLAEVDADHWGLIGWSGGFDAAGLYASLLERLRARGL
jgi:triacylglycerol lipase